MEQQSSLFIKWLDKYFTGIVVKTVEKLNRKNEATLTYMFKYMLRKEFSMSGKWETITTLNTRVSADVVAMDSSLPLKRRERLNKKTGDIAKCGMELWLNETQLTELNMLVHSNVDDKVIVAKLFQDTPKVISGIYELMEKLFLEGLSTGEVLVEDDKNTGTGVYLDFGYLDENKFGVSVLWNSATAKPLNDIGAAIKKAKKDGNSISEVYMDDVTFENFVKTEQVKEYFAFSIGFFGDKAIVPLPTLDKINAALKADNRYKFTIHIVDRTIIVEKNGKRETVTPWSEGKVILTTSQEVGVLVYARLAEQDNPVPGVTYQTVDGYMLISKFRENRPSLKEFTTSQARVVPVVCNVEQIYQLDSKVIQA
jgi:hypothetical protein